MSPTIALADVIGYVETKNDPHGYRFEPVIYQKLSAGQYNQATIDILATIAKIHNCSHATAECIFSCSFGATQILAENLYDPAIGLKADVFAYQDDPVLQASTFADFVKWKNIEYTAEALLVPQTREHFALIYNGSISYADLISQSLTHWGVK